MAALNQNAVKSSFSSKIRAIFYIFCLFYYILGRKIFPSSSRSKINWRSCSPSRLSVGLLRSFLCLCLNRQFWFCVGDIYGYACLLTYCYVSLFLYHVQVRTLGVG